MNIFCLLFQFKQFTKF